MIENTFEPEVATMNIVRSKQSRELIEEALIPNGDNNLVNASFMISPKQREVIQQLAKENRFSQGVVVRIIIDEWMTNQVRGCD